MQPLPPFRHDLRYFQGPEADDGSATYTVFDPVKGEYFKITWAEMLIIRHHKKGFTAQELANAINANSTLHLTPEAIVLFFNQAHQQGLLSSYHSSEEIEKRYKQEKMGWFTSFIHNYLFFKIPLFKPDAFLEKTYPMLSPLFTLKALFIYLLIAFIGLMTFFLHWDAFLSTFPYFFNLQGILAYALAIASMKILHEFAHAYTAKKFGVHIPSMGVAILLLFPVLYTDATDVWRLPKRSQRIAISSAGVLVELLVAGLATIGWAYTAPGLLNSVFFVLASLNWINTLIINLNPALRFDGYYILSDWMKVENLQARSFALLRHHCYKIFLGLSLPNPEENLSGSKRTGMFFYGLYTLFYRIAIYTAIALFVYFKFTKAIGILLFFLEVIIFFIWPVAYETYLLRRLRPLLKWNRRLLCTTLGAFLLLAWATLPLPHHNSFSAITTPKEKEVLYARHAGKITEMHMQREEPVSKGALLLLIDSPTLNFQQQIKEKEMEISRKRLEIISEKEKLQPFYLEKQAELSKIEAELQSLQEQLEQNKIIANYDGVAYALNPFLKEGLYIADNEYLGSIGTPETALDIFVPEAQLEKLKVGERGYFYSVAGQAPVEYTITRIAPVRSRTLPHPQLSSLHQGELPTTAHLELVSSFYAVRAEPLTKAILPFGLTGTFVYRGPWTSYVGELMRKISAVLIEESQIE